MLAKKELYLSDYKFTLSAFLQRENAILVHANLFTHVTDAYAKGSVMIKYNLETAEMNESVFFPDIHSAENLNLPIDF